MQKVKAGFEKCWNGTAYRHPEYNGETDDRVHALAVISGIADKSKYDAIFKVFKTQKHASPYMEKYVMEALFKMGHGGYALDRAEERFKKMVDDPRYTTLFEGWEKDGFGGGSVNHAWSGGAITVISSELCGLRPLEPAWKKFAVEPQPANFQTGVAGLPNRFGRSEIVIRARRFGVHHGRVGADARSRFPPRILQRQNPARKRQNRFRKNRKRQTHFRTAQRRLFDNRQITHAQTPQKNGERFAAPPFSQIPPTP